MPDDDKWILDSDESPEVKDAWQHACCIGPYDVCFMLTFALLHPDSPLQWDATGMAINAAWEASNKDPFRNMD